MLVKTIDGNQEILVNSVEVPVAVRFMSRDEMIGLLATLAVAVRDNHDIVTIGNHKSFDKEQFIQSLSQYGKSKGTNGINRARLMPKPMLVKDEEIAEETTKEEVKNEEKTEKVDQKEDGFEQN
jgi:hypothetical protein